MEGGGGTLEGGSLARAFWCVVAPGGGKRESALAASRAHIVSRHRRQFMSGSGPGSPQLSPRQTHGGPWLDSSAHFSIMFTYLSHNLFRLSPSLLSSAHLL